MKHFKALGALSLPIVLTLAACGHRGPNLRATTPASEAHIVVVDPSVGQVDIRAAVARALADQNYSTEKDDPGLIVARYAKGSRQLKLGIEYDTQRVTFHYMDSQGLAVGVDAQGQPLLDKHYSDLIAKLDGAIQAELKRPAQEAAAQAKAKANAEAEAVRQARQDQIDAEERLRQYNLQLEREKTRQANAQANAAQARALMPPAPRAETVPPRPGPDYYWTPGHWTLENNRYVWIGGFWAQSYATMAPPPPRAEDPGIPPSDQHFWVRGHWRWTGNAYAWIGGYWDTSRVGYTFVPAHWENVDGRWTHIDGQWVTRTTTVTLAPPPPPVTYAPPAQPAAPPPPPDCRQVLIETRNNASAMMFCDGAEPNCAAALLRKGHNPSALMFCKGVEPNCAVSLINRGDNPSALINCKR